MSSLPLLFGVALALSPADPPPPVVTPAPAAAPALAPVPTLSVAGGSPAHADLSRLRDILLDRQSPLAQSQAALMLLAHPDPDACALVRQGLRQTDVPEVFLALCIGVRLTQDPRFPDELIAALASPRPGVRPAAAEALAATASSEVILRLQALAEDRRAELPVRLAALSALGRSGRKAAAVVLLDQLSADQEPLRAAAADALVELTGESYGTDLPRWRQWWERTKNLTNERWLENRLAYQTGRARRLEGDLDRARAQIVRLHQQLYARLTAADRLGHLQHLADQDDPAVRALAVPWTVELLPGADAVGQRALADVLLRLAQDTTPDIQRGAVLALGRVADPRVVDRLDPLMKRGAPAVRAAAARALASQARGTGPDTAARRARIVPVLQKALEDPAIEVVVEAAEGLGALGDPEASPVLASLLAHASEPVRQTAAQALERVANTAVLDALLKGLDDPAVSVRFSLLGAVAHAAADGRSLTEPQKQSLLARLDTALVKDLDPGVRSRAATVLGDCCGPAALPALWKRVTASEDARVQEKAWAALVEVLARASALPLVQEWDRTLKDAGQPDRRVLMLTEVAARWEKRPDARAAADSILELLVQAELEQGKWQAAAPRVRDLLTRAAAEPDLDRRLGWLLTVGELALRQGQKAEALRAVQDAQAPLTRRNLLAASFEKLEKQARQAP